MRRDTGVYARKRTLSNGTIVLCTLVVCICCWITEYFFSINYPVQDGSAMPVWQWMTGFLSGKPMTYITGAVLLCLMSAMAQRANYHLMIIHEKGFLPFLLFIVLNSTNFGLIPVRPVSVAFFFLLLCMVELFIVYEEDGLTPDKAYKAMVCLAAGSLIWIHLLWFIPLFWYGMYLFRLFNVRNFGASCLGIFTVYWIVAGRCAWKHDFTVFAVAVQHLTAFDRIFSPEYMDVQRLVVPVTALTAMLLLDMYLRFHDFNVGLRTRRFVVFLSAAAKYVMCFLFLFKEEQADFLCLFFLPFSLLIAYIFSNMSGKYIVLHYCLIELTFVTLFLFRHLEAGG